MSYDGEGHVSGCTCQSCTGWMPARERELVLAVRHVLKRGKLGKRSKQRLRDAVRRYA